jgi:hypothetical protein
MTALRTPRLASVLLLLAGLAPGSLACSSSSVTCVPDGTLTVTVTDQDVDNPDNYLCNVQVTATASSGKVSTLTAQGYDGSAANCIYETNLAPGTYTVTATASGYTAMSQTITLQQVACVTASPAVGIGLFESNEGQPDAGG